MANGADVQRGLKARLKAEFKARILKEIKGAGSEHGGAPDVAVAPAEAPVAVVVESQEKPSQSDTGKAVAAPGTRGKAVLAPEKGEAVAAPEKGKAIAAPTVDSVKIPFKIGELVSCSRGDDHRTAEVVDWRETSEAGMIKYYVHYIGYDKRLDEWVPWIRLKELNEKLDLAPSKLPPIPPISPAGVGQGSPFTRRTPTRRVTRSLKSQFDSINIFPQLTEDLPALDQLLETEHKEKSKVKNFKDIWLGKHEIHTWYYSPYPEEYHQDRLYICEFCLKYMRKWKTIEDHKKTCAPKFPPGDEIYEATAPIDGQVGKSESTDLESTPPTSGTRSFNSKNVQQISMYEVDGSKYKLYCQFLCLLAGVFLDHKTLYYEVDSFLFYILTENDDSGKHLAGYFSKEKHSEENFNIACILTLPPYQRKGYGQFLIDFAYALSKKEGKVGTPERPFSDLGKATFTIYWQRVLLETIRDHRDASVKDLTKWTCIHSDDVISTLKPLGLVKFWKLEYVPNFYKRIVDKQLKNVKSQPDWLKIDMDKLNWPSVPRVGPYTPKNNRTPQKLRPVRPSP